MKNFIGLFLGLFVVLQISASAPLWLRYTSISPDGHSILFTYNADLYKVNANGGTATLLTLYEGRDFMPVWSPDGEKIAFASDRHGNYDVFVMDADGKNLQRLTYHSSNDYPYAFSEDGQSVIFSSFRHEGAQSVYFPKSVQPETYEVPVKGGKEKLITPVPMEAISIKGDQWLYQDKKGYEDPFRKHHTSSVTRDIWMFNSKEKKHTQLTTFNGEDRNPIWINDQEYYYLSEKSGTFNIWKGHLNGDASKQITQLKNHPVRHLSLSNNGTLCFSYDGEVYTVKEGNEPKKVSIDIQSGPRYEDIIHEVKKGGITEMDLSPDGKEICFVVRGEVFVASLQSGITKRITNTPWQERSVGFSPDGKSIVYAAEKDNIWGVYQTKRVKEEETHFFNATVLKEEPLVVNENENFQPQFNHDGTEVAYLEDRTTLKIYNLESKKSRLILAGDRNYSYSDGDQWFDWSPDGKYLLVDFLEPKSWISQIGLVSSDGKGEILNLTESGYGASRGSWMMNGDMIIYFSGRNGMKNHASWGFQGDIYGLYFSQEAYQKSNLSEMELEILKEQEKEKKSDKKEEKEEKDKVIPIKIDYDGLKTRKKRLTIHSSSLAGGVVSDNGESLYYLSKFEKGYDLWVHHFYKNETKILHKLSAGSVGSLTLDEENKNLFLIANGKPVKISIDGKKKTPIAFQADFELKPAKEREYIYDHAWRQVVKKFYLKDLHGVDWAFYGEAYRKFLPHINNNYDFAEMLSELLGELNASHTGCRYRPKHNNADHTAALGVFFDHNYKGEGLKIEKIIDQGPIALASDKIKEGNILLAINDIALDEKNTYEKLMNRKADETLLFKFTNGKVTWEERIKPISRGKLSQLHYEQWVKDREDEVEKLSEGRLGYVHVQGMNDESFRRVYEKALGKYNDKEGLIVDTRFNGGGWLHDDLATFLNGEKYFTFMPRGQNLGDEPQFKWRRPSVVLMGEGNYSDAHMFPETYRALDIGKLIGMPVPGTATAVWWETQIDQSLVFGIPQVGIQNRKGEYLENNQTEPDIKVANTPEKAVTGVDEQIKTAVEELLK